MNNVGFGKTCEEHKIKVTGFTTSSESKKERIQESEITRKCEEATRKVNQLREQLRRVDEESSEFGRLEQQLISKAEEKAEFCMRQLRELSTLDHVKFRIEYTPMPEYVRRYVTVLETAVKGGLLPFMTKLKDGNRKNNEVDVELKFNPHLNTVNMILTTEYETIQYNNIRLPEQMENIIPLTTSERIEEQLSKAFIGEPATKRCTIGEDVVRSFDDKTYRYELDDCYHVLASDCGKGHTFAVLGKLVDGKKHVMVYVEKSKITMEPSRSYTESRKEYEVEIDGQSLFTEKGETKEFKSLDGKVTYRIHRTPDSVLILETPYNRITYDGKTVEIEHMITEKAPKCGLCGDHNGDKKVDIKTSQQCIAMTVQQAALSYRVQRSCSAPSPRQQQIKQQQQICHVEQQQQKKEAKTQFSQVVRSQVEKCERKMHSLIQHGSRTCISQIPVTQCGSGCSARSNISKIVPFTCLPVGNKRVVKLYVEKVRRGDVLPELRNMEKSFSSQLEIPVSCAHPGF